MRSPVQEIEGLTSHLERKGVASVAAADAAAAAVATATIAITTSATTIAVAS